MRQLIWTFFGCIFAYLLSAQADPTFSSFKGDHYRIPGKISLGHKGYTKEIYDYENMGPLEYDQINIGDILNKQNFPGTKMKQRLCMVLFSEMTIAQDACYEFELQSDDGSRLWIDDKHIINNDGNHKFRTRKDSVYLNKGNYDIKLWYMQLFPNRYGFVFNSKMISESCDTTIFPKTKKISLNAKVLFDTDSSELSLKGKEKLDSLVMNLSVTKFKKMKITGHTDSQGTSAYNLVLSQRRANAIRRYFENKKGFNHIHFQSIGVGEQRPIAENFTSEGRAKNRRVEIVLE